MGKKLIIPGADFSANAIAITTIKTVQPFQTFQIKDDDGVKTFTSDANGVCEIEGYLKFTSSSSAINFFNNSPSETNTVIEKVLNLRLKTGSMVYAFYRCSALKEVTFADLQDTGTTINFTHAFEFCTSLEKVGFKALSKIKTLTLTKMFYSSSKSILTLDMSRFDTSQIGGIANFFNINGSLPAPSLKEIDFSGWDLGSFDTSNTSKYEYAFNLCSNIEKAIVNNCSAATITKLKTILSTISSSNPLVWIESTDASGNTILVPQT